MFSDWCYCYRRFFFHVSCVLANLVSIIFVLVFYFVFSLFNFALYIFCVLLVEEPNLWSQILGLKSQSYLRYQIFNDSCIVNRSRTNKVKDFLHLDTLNLQFHWPSMAILWYKWYIFVLPNKGKVLYYNEKSLQILNTAVNSKTEYGKNCLRPVCTARSSNLVNFLAHGTWQWPKLVKTSFAVFTRFL